MTFATTFAPRDRDVTFVYAPEIRASGTVPVDSADAFNDVRAVPLPTNAVAVTVPVTSNAVEGVVLFTPTRLFAASTNKTPLSKFTLAANVDTPVIFN